MDEGFDFHWYAGKAPYFVTPEGRKLYCKLRGRVPVIGDGSIATPAQDEKAAHDVSYTSVRADIERYQVKLKREAAARAEEEKGCGPSYVNTAVHR